MTKHTSQQNNIPELRFPEFNSNWHTKKLSDVLTVRGVKNHNNVYSKADVLSVSREYGVVNQIKHLGRSYAGKDVGNYGVARKGDIIYTKSPLKDNPFGIIKANCGRDGIVSTLYAIYEVKDGNDFIFLDKYFELDDRTNHYLMPLVNKGAKNDMKISNERVLIDPVTFPEYDEQKKIANFFVTIDMWISNLKNQRDELEEYKRGMMQKIFTQEIRFKDTNGKLFPAWEITTLDKVFEKKNQRNFDNKCKEVLTNSAVRGIVKQRDYFDKDIANQENLLNYYVVELDDFIYNPRISKSAPVGPLKRNKSGRGIMSPLYTVLTLNTGSLGFYEYYFDTNLWHRYMYMISNFGARHDRMNIRDKDLMKMPLPFPVQIEQEKIAEFLSSIDELVKAKANQVKDAEIWEKGLLQKMFV